MDEFSSADRAEILELIARYAYLWDAKDADGVSHLYTEDAIHESFVNGASTPVSRVQSRAAFRNIAADSFQGRLVGVQTRHHQNSTVLTEIHADSARGMTMFLATHQRSDEAAPRLIFSGVFEDTFVKTADGWRFAHRSAYVGGPPPPN